jgi:hypothetical protein
MVGRLLGDRERWSFMRSKPEDVGVPGGVTLPVLLRGEILLGLIGAEVGDGGPHVDE